MVPGYHVAATSTVIAQNNRVRLHDVVWRVFAKRKYDFFNGTRRDKPYLFCAEIPIIYY